MALDATPGGTAADSYLELEEADALAESLGLSSWAEKADAEKEAALRAAALEIDAHRFHHGTPYAEGQARAFPREKDEGAIPEPVKVAAMYQAEWNAVTGEGDRKLWEGKKAGALKDSGNGSPLCPKALAQLSRFISRVGTFD